MDANQEKNLKVKLDSILTEMDVPENRKDLNKPGNLEWLGRNLFIKNKDHAKFVDALAVLNKLGKLNKVMREFFELKNK